MESPSSMMTTYMSSASRVKIDKDFRAFICGISMYVLLRVSFNIYRLHSFIAFLIFISEWIEKLKIKEEKKSKKALSSGKVFFSNFFRCDMNDVIVFLSFGCLIFCCVTLAVYTVVIMRRRSSIDPSLDAIEDHQRINTKDPAATRFSDKIIINAAVPWSCR